MGCAVTFHDRIGRERLAAAVEPLDPDASLALLESALTETAHAAIGGLDCEVEVSFVADAEMSRLHFDHMGERGPTDVLSFPLHEWVVDGGSRLVDDDGASPPGPLLLGDVVIDVDQAVRQAAAVTTSVVEEIVLLAIHGTLHLVGHDHAEPEEEEAMRAMERQVLATLRRRHREIEWHPGSLFDHAEHALGPGV